MTRLLSERLGLGAHEMVAIVGAGGKTTILHALGRELAQAGHRVVLTTTTKMASDQVTDPAVHGAEPTLVDASFVDGAPLFVVAGHNAGKADGLAPDDVDRLFSETSADYVIVEADGARTMSIKAPAEHEPVIPSATTTVIVVIGADAIDRRVGDVAHRPHRVAALTGVSHNGIVTSQVAAAIVLHPDGGLKAIPGDARAVVVLNKTGVASSDNVAVFTALVDADDRVERVVTLA